MTWDGETKQEQPAIVRRDGKQRAAGVLRDVAATALLSRESRRAVRSVSLVGRASTRWAAAGAAGSREARRGVACGLCPPRRSRRSFAESRPWWSEPTHAEHAWKSLGKRPLGREIGSVVATGSQRRRARDDGSVRGSDGVARWHRPGGTCLRRDSITPPLASSRVDGRLSRL